MAVNEVIAGGGEAVRADQIRVGDRVRLDGPDGLRAWAEVKGATLKPKTVWLSLVYYGNLRPRHDDMFAVRRATN